MLREVLGVVGYAVLSAPSGNVALGLILERRPDLILLDLAMPDGDGWMLGEELARRQLDVPIVVITAVVQELAVRACAQIGAAAYLAKPFDVADLTAIAESLTRLAAASR